MTTPAGSPGTAGRNYRVPVKEGRHRAPPEPPPPDRWIAPIAAAAVLLTAASLIAIYATGIAPDATAAGRHGLTVSTAARSARTVHVPLTVLPVPVPTPTPSEPRGGQETTWGVPRRPASVPEAPQEALAAITEPTLTEQPLATQPDTTEDPPAPPDEDTAAADTTPSSDPTEETTVTPGPTADPTPTDIGDVIDEVLGTETP